MNSNKNENENQNQHQHQSYSTNGMLDNYLNANPIPPVSGNAPVAKKTYNWVGISMFIFSTIVIIMQIVCFYIFKATKIVSEDMQQWVLVIIPMYCIAFPVLYLLLRKVEPYKREKEKLSAGKFFKILCICFALMFVGNIIGNLLMNTISGGSAENPLNKAVEGNFIMKVLVMVILAPIIEETIFRKFIIDRTEQYGEKAAILFSALSFGLFHMNFFQFFYAFALGWVFGYVYVRTKDLKYSIVLHMIVNFMGSVVSSIAASWIDYELVEEFNKTNNPELMEQVMPGILAFFSYLIIYMAIVIIGVVFLIKSLPRLVFFIRNEQISKEETFSTIYLNVGVILFYLVCILMIISNTVSSI